MADASRAIDAAAYNFTRYTYPTSRHLLAGIGVQMLHLAGTCPHNETKRGFMENTLMDLNQLSTLLGRSTETIKKDLKRNRLAVPPRLYIPGTRLLRWRRIDVEAWLASHVESRPGDAK